MICIVYIFLSLIVFIWTWMTVWVGKQSDKHHEDKDFL